MTAITESPLFETLLAAKKSASLISSLSPAQRQEVIERMAAFIERREDEILSANKHDMSRAQKLLDSGEITKSVLDRLKLDSSKLKGIVEGVRQVASLPDPVGAISLARELDDGLKLYRVTSPIGVIAVIFESRPDVLPQIASLAVRSGNVAVLKGGKEARFTLTVLFECLQQALGEKGLPSQSLVLLHNREDIEAILKADGLVDLVIPRGSNQLVRYIQDNTRIPVLGHAEGLCSMYVHSDADLEMAVNLAVDGKTQYPAACNTIETLLVHATVAGAYLPRVAKELFDRNVELRADGRAFEIISNSGVVPPATDGASASNGEVPSVASGVPASNGEVPSVASGVPASNGEVPSVASGVPAASTGVPSASSGVSESNRGKDASARNGEASQSESSCGSAESNCEVGSSEPANVSKRASLIRARNDDWSTEFSDLVLAIKVVDSLDEAVDHINHFGSNHTDCIVTADVATYEAFFKVVNSAGVYWNASTRFADGFRYGFGAEVGISTNKMHPRGPVGLEGLVSYKYKLVGKGHVVKDYSGENARKYKHRDIEL